MSKEDIDKAVREAEQFAAEDSKRREVVDAKNAGESMVYSVQKSLEELGDKVSADEKSAIQAKSDALSEAIKGDDAAAIKAATEELQKAFYPVYERISKEAGAAAGAQPGPDGGNVPPQGGSDGNVYNADYKDVDDSKK